MMHNSNLKKIGVFTSGGDAPGMNAAIRAVVRTAIHYKLEVTGIRYGYNGMIEDDFIKMESSSVANIIQRGGTILKTARSKGFMTEEGRAKAYKNLKKHGIEGLIAIGGDGTFRGALEFSGEHDIPIIGLPGTIDNDLIGTDFTIGYDTALNTVIEAVDKIRDTAESHNRLFFVEVMGRDAGLIALRSGIGVGAEAILIPETPTNLETLVAKLKNDKRRKKSSNIIIVAEGDEAGGAIEIAEKVKKELTQYDTRVTILGHIQRGGSPSCMDRVLASRMGFHSVEALLDGRKGQMVGIIDKKVAYTDFKNAVKHIEAPYPDLIRMAEILAS